MNLYVLCLALALPGAEPVPVGDSQRVVRAGDVDITVHLHRPADANPKMLVLVFHGTLRNASEYRDWAKPIAEKLSAVVAAPEFDAKRFPSSAYQQGGVRDANREVQPKEKWTFSRVPEIAAALKADLAAAELPVCLIGHSAGGQFLHRLAAFTDPGAKTIVAANPGTLLFPTREQKFGYGFGGLPEALADDAALKRYLAAPLVVYLGTGDKATTKEQDKHLEVSPEATKQGACRYDRGRAFFRAGEQLAKERAWPFRWRLVEAPDVGHSAQNMFKHPRCSEALGR